MAKFCPNCGTEVKDGADICLNCGKQVSKTEQAGGNAAAGAKSKVLAGCLALFLGSLGVHNFYLGYTGKGVAQLLISLLTCGFGAMISGIWAFIEGIMIFTGSINTDANGNPLAS